MTRTSNRVFRASAAALALAASLSSLASAASINYGSFTVPSPPTSISFLDVTESSGTDPVPLYGPPSPFSVGLDFNPQSFVATSAGGGADITDGQLNLSVKSNVVNLLLKPILGLNLSEGGDYTLVGVGTAASQVFAGAIINAKIVEVDGALLANPISFTSNSSVNYNLVANSGVVKPWSLSVFADVQGALLAAGVPYTIGATKVDVVINNSLVAISEAASVAFIAKKDFVLSTIPGDPQPFPEPTSAVMAFLAFAGFGLSSARKRS